MKKVAFVTSEKMAQLNPRESGLVEQLRVRGVEVIPYVWSRAEDERRKYDAILLRSPWDYSERIEEFASWIERLPSQKVYNPKAILKWNLDKLYLRELESKGVRIVPTKWVRTTTPEELRTITLHSEWNEMVIKPTRSAGAFKTIRFNKNALPDFSVYDQLSVMIQPMVPEILTEGEWSLIYLGGKFSHALVKRPRQGDFRVQYLYGGSETPVTPDALHLDFGKRVMDAVPGELLYARVDFVRIQGQPYLMELEVLEPDLFFHLEPAAASRFADELLLRLASHL